MERDPLGDTRCWKGGGDQRAIKKVATRAGETLGQRLAATIPCWQRWGPWGAGYPEGWRGGRPMAGGGEAVRPSATSLP